MYLFAPNGDGTHRAGVYKSTDGGANFSPTTGQPTGFAPGNGWTLYTTPGFPGHLWLSQIQYWDSGNYIAHSPDGGATWVNINPGLTRVLNFTMGKQAPNGIYPRLFKRVFERGTFIWFYSDDKGATWVNFGTGAATIPAGSYLAHPTFCMGDWNNVGRLYVGWGKAGAIYYNP